MYTSKNNPTTIGVKKRSLENYIALHKEKHPQVVSARTLTEARIICFGKKRKR